MRLWFNVNDFSFTLKLLMSGSLLIVKIVQQLVNVNDYITTGMLLRKLLRNKELKTKSLRSCRIKRRVKGPTLS